MKKLGFVLLTVSLILIFWRLGFLVTGNVVGRSFEVHSFFDLIVIILFIVSVFLLNAKKRGLEYLVIPLGWEEDRLDRAKKELDVKKFDKIIVTGHVAKGEVKGSRRQKIYHSMREYGIKPSEMGILNGIDSEEDVLYLGRMLRRGDGVTIDTFPLHYGEYKTLIAKARKDGKFPDGVRIKNAKTRQGIKEFIYGIAGWGEEVLKRRKLAYVSDRKEGYFGKLYSSTKEGVKKLLR